MWGALILVSFVRLVPTSMSLVRLLFEDEVFQSLFGLTGRDLLRFAVFGYLLDCRRGVSLSIDSSWVRKNAFLRGLELVSLRDGGRR